MPFLLKGSHEPRVTILKTRLLNIWYVTDFNGSGYKTYKQNSFKKLERSCAQDVIVGSLTLILVEQKKKSGMNIVIYE